MPTTYRIHPGIGISRLGNSPDAFCISPEKPAALPLDCDGRGNPLLTPDAVKGLWERIKTQEQAEKPKRRTADAAQSALAGVPIALPALIRALKLQAKAGNVGFDWRDPLAVLGKIREEADEIETELANDQRSAAAAEVGDLLFAVANLARHLDIDPEAALRGTNQKFEHRFMEVERALAARGKRPAEATLAEMDRLWNEAKSAEKARNAAERKGGS